MLGSRCPSAAPEIPAPRFAERLQVTTDTVFHSSVLLSQFSLTFEVCIFFQIVKGETKALSMLAKLTELPVKHEKIRHGSTSCVAGETTKGSIVVSLIWCIRRVRVTV